MQRGTLIHVWWIRYSDGVLACCSSGYEKAVEMAEKHIKGTDLTYLIY